MKKLTIALIIIAAVIVLPLIWYLASPLFLDTVVNEEFPIPESIPEENTTQPEMEEAQEDTSTTIAQAEFTGADSFHEVSGTAIVIESNGERILRLEDFSSTNGPDLKVYLASDLEATNYVSLGGLKGNIGNQNYNIPEGTNLEDYPYALIWCEQFSVLFGSAELN